MRCWCTCHQQAFCRICSKAQPDGSRCRISLDNAPFRVLKETVKVCIFGTEYYKKTPEKRQKGSGLECHWLAEGGIQDSNATVWPKDEHKKKK
ncbi:uncharacterized protein LOC119176453 isoform X2 [Rhipicephalus microplus]|uniref:uncharacterized protein LOC119176453 isoform X2 n=1 Tax=Rhipicephalus microplus TaxID=6941 RepID=UPI003F6BC989